VFKTDGLWCLFGDTPDALQVEQMDPTLRMTGTQLNGVQQAGYDTQAWVRRLGNVVFAWTQKGVFALSPSGQTRVDDAVATELRAWIPSLREGTTITRTFSAVDNQQGLVIFGAYAHTRAPNGFAYALHVDSGTWWTMTTKLRAFVSAGFWSGSGDSDRDRAMLSAIDGFTLYRDPPEQYDANIAPGLPLAFSDRTYGSGATTTFNITNVAADGVTITGTPSIGMCGCLVSKGGQTYIALPPTPDALTGTLVLDRTGITTGNATIEYYPIEKLITYASTTEGTPAIEKYFRRAYFGFQRLRGGTYFETRYRARDKAAPSTYIVNQYPTQASATPLTSAIGLTANREFEQARDIHTGQTRATGVAVTFRHSQAATYLAIDSMSLREDDRSDRSGGRT